MTNPYYNKVFDVTPGNAVRSQAIEDEFSRVASGCDAIKTAMDLKATLANPTFTGHVTVPTPTATTDAVTKAYADGLAFATALPSQTGNAGKYVTTDGTNASWGAITQVGTGGTTSTGSITLTASSPAAMTITPATPGLYITLPDATTCTKADNLYSVYNAGDYDYGVKDSAGTQLGWIRPKTGAMIGLSDSSTAAGVWTYYGLEKLGVTAQIVSALSVAGTAGTAVRIAVDSNRTAFVFGSTACYAIVYDASTQTWGSAALVRSSIGTNKLNAVLSAANQIMVVTCDSTTGYEAVTLTLSGTTITVNSGTKATAGLGGTMASMGQLIAVGASFVTSYIYSGIPCIRAISVSGTTPAIGAESSLSGGANPGVLFASGSVVRTVSGDSGAGSIYCKPFTVSGSTLTGGTQASAASGTNAYVFKAFLNGNGNIICGYPNSSSLSVTIFKLTGTTEAASTVSPGVGINSWPSCFDFVNVGTNKTLFVTWSTYAYASLLTDTSGTASFGSVVTLFSNGTPSALQGILVSGNNARVGIYTNAAMRQHTIDCSGANPSVVSTQQLPIATGSASFGGSDNYGNRDSLTLISGQSAYWIGTLFDMYSTSNSLTRRASGAINQTLLYKGMVGAANEAWHFGTATDISNSYQFVRIEAAA